VVKPATAHSWKRGDARASAIEPTASAALGAMPKVGLLV